ncbi:hypothetical protein DYB32_003110 [Aphanomyces invadans]|uniref:Saposin B-type domain-containing protein n=1 Tax=Aphanomyces invadans TaxID=157072 RepID=A0A3R7D357_9STRA|nr:hypothetical protein DYB32_003110 [Aphanomyces invadans]
MVGWIVSVVLAGLAGASPDALFPTDEEVGRWTTGHGDVLPTEFHPSQDDAAWLTCMLCRSSTTYMDQVRRLPQISFPALVGGVDVTCAWLARNKSSPTCDKLADKVSAIKKSLEHGECVAKICRDQMHMCGKHDDPHGRPTLAEPRDAILGGFHPKCMQCWVAVHYVNDTRRQRDLPVKAVQIGAAIVCERGDSHRTGCHTLTHHVPAILEGLTNGSTAMEMCRHMHYCPGTPHVRLPHAVAPPPQYSTPEVPLVEGALKDPPKVDATVGIGVSWACAVMALIALLYCAFAKSFRVDPTSAYIGIPQDE